MKKLILATVTNFCFFSLVWADFSGSGVYKITNCNSYKVMDVDGAGTSNGTLIQQWDYSDVEQQKWKAVDGGNGYFKLISLKSGKAIDIAAQSKINGANIHQWESYNNLDSQLWQIVPIGNYKYKILSKLSGKSLNVKYSSKDNGADLEQWDYNGGESEKWYFDTVSAEAAKTATEPSKTTTTPVFQNGTMMQSFHWYTSEDGNFWNNVANDAQKLSELGVSAVWLPPAYKGSGGAKDVGYGVYDMYDLGEFNQKGSLRTKYGTKDQYLAAINALHNKGVQVYADVVLNHRFGADSTSWIDTKVVDEKDRNRELYDKWVEGWVNFDFPGRNNKYSSFKWKWYHFDGVNWDESKKENAIYKIKGTGKGWDNEVDNENGNYDYLMGADLDMSNPEVVNEINNWGKWYLDFTNVDGFRLDAVKHIKFDTMGNWVNNMRQYSKKELFSVGEYWSGDLGKLKNYITKSNNSMSLFDVPLHMNLYNASRSGGAYDMGSILNNTLMKDNPSKAVTFVENHDTQPLQSLESTVDWWFKSMAYSITLLRAEGYPCVFYPDVYGATYTDKGKDGKYYTINLAPVSKLDLIMKARKNYAYGKQNSYLDHWDVIGWTREGDSQHPKAMAVVMSDAGAGSKWMYVGRNNAAFKDYLGNRGDTVYSNQTGWAEFKCNAGSVAVWVEQ